MFLVDEISSPAGRTRRFTVPTECADVNEVYINLSAKQSIQQRGMSTVSCPEVGRTNSLMNGRFWKTMKDENNFWNDARWFFDEGVF